MNTIVTIKESNTEVNDVNYEMKEVNTLEQEDDWYLDQITDDLIDTWETILIKNITHEVRLIKDDAEILNEKLDLPIQKIIKNDVDRTRVRDTKLLPDFKQYLECLLTFYCRTNGIKYKQGMNEILGPFILLKSKVQISLSRTYNLFTCFMEFYLTNYFREVELYSLQSSLALVRILLRYHDPEMHNTFEYALITPEMYATSWILTIFASKSRLDVAYYLWNLIILENDQLMIYFVIISFLKLHRESILTCDISLIPAYLSQMSIKSFEEVKEIFFTAKKLREFTPSSFGLMTKQLEVFRPKSEKLKELYNYYDPYNMFAMPLLPSEVFYITFRDIVNCPNESCRKFKSSNPAEDFCKFCLNTPNLNYILLDLRIQSDSLNNKNFSFDDKPGFLPMTVIVEQEELLLDDFSERISERFLNEKEQYHFILITSETDYFIDYENKFYFEKISDRERFKMMYGLQTRINKEINFKVVKNSMKKDKTKSLILKLKEFDNFKNTILKFLKKNFPYISYVHGGFREIHDEAIKFEIPLLNHEEDKCELCLRTKGSNERFGFFKKFFSRREKVCVTENDERLSLDKAKTQNSLKSGYCLTQEDKIGTSLDKQYSFDTADPDYFLSVEEISSLISDPRYAVFTCLHLDTRLFSENNIKNQQLMLFMDTEEIKIFKLKRRKIGNNTSIPEEGKNNDSLSFIMIENVKIKDIICIMTRKTNKNIVTIKYMSNSNELTIIFDMITDQDSKNFITTSRKMMGRDESEIEEQS